MSQQPVFRLSKQRKVILEELCKVDTHPTADEVYEMVRRILPRISLGTVYRNLEFLHSQGLVLKLGVAGAQKRFDGNPSPHPHIRCQVCNKVEDVHYEVTPPELPEEYSRGYHAVRGEVDFVGVCPQCQASAS